MATLCERILGQEAGVYVDREVDRAFCHDGTGVLAHLAWQAMGSPTIKIPYKCHIIFDHIVPANNSTTANLQHELRKFAVSKCMHFSDIGGGICHQVMSEGKVLPGEVVVGADSHSCTMGAFGAFATGVGATDLAAIWAGGENWFRVPETTEIKLTGKTAPFVEAKDIALAYVKELGMDGATYRALEFTGDAVPKLGMDERLTLCNMAIESGAKTGMFYADNITKKYLSDFGTLIKPQEKEECDYVDEREIELDDLCPLVSVPHRVDTVYPVSDYAGTELDQVFVGTCTNGRYEDLKRFADIVKGEKVSVRTVVVPASKDVLLKAAVTGVLETIIKSGCAVGTPGCGPCLGAHMGVLGEGEVGLSTANRNFKNRMGVGAEYYLSSVSTAAVSAITGEITNPEEFS